MAALRRSPLELLVALAIPLTVLAFAFGSSSVATLSRIGASGRWAALFVLTGLALARLLTSPRAAIRPIPAAWGIAAAFVLVAADSALWSVHAHATLGRSFTLGVVFVAAAALALGLPDAREAAARVLDGVLVGAALVALAGLGLLAADHRLATEQGGSGERFRGIGVSADTVPMLLGLALPISLWWAMARSGRARWVGVALVVLFTGELGFSASRSGLAAGFGGALVTAVVLGRSPRARLAAGAAVLVLAAVAVGLWKGPLAATGGGAGHRVVGPGRPGDANLIFRLEDEIGFPRHGSYQPQVPRTIFGTSGRIEAWRGAFLQAARRPVAGYGFGTEGSVFQDRFYGFQGNYAENTYLGLFLQLGAVGVALLVALLAALFASAARVLWRGPPRSLGPGAAALGALVAGLLSGVGQSGLTSAGNVATAGLWLCAFTLPILAREAEP